MVDLPGAEVRASAVDQFGRGIVRREAGDRGRTRLLRLRLGEDGRGWIDAQPGDRRLATEHQGERDRTGRLLALDGDASRSGHTRLVPPELSARIRRGGRGLPGS